ncbi:MAG: exodeoxyribonuclease III [Anaerolineaceae bacterium]|jgi:exodeoxyribonuclease-3|nr:exodeoxyribonuclease III [Anaerolineaceae bacterium]
MKITTWNVNGIRAAINKGFIDWFAEASPDVLCLQEVKAYKEQVSEDLTQVSGYHQFWNSADRPGYSGVATFTKTKPIEMTAGFGVEAYTGEGRTIITKHPRFYLFNVYFPNGQRDQGRLDYKLGFYEALLAYCEELIAAGNEVVITGDFNTAHREIDLANPKSNEKNSGFLPIEREWIDRFLERGFIDAFRALYPDKVQYSWWTYRFGARSRNVGWRLDYHLVTKGVMDRVKDVIIHDDVLGSDHCPVSLILKD